MSNSIENSENVIELNNAKTVLDNVKSNQDSIPVRFLTLVQGNKFGGVDISDSNIENNSRFIVDLWD